MIGKSEWFAMRKYGGWGIRPKTWQGWVYIVCFLLPFFLFNSFTLWTEQTKLIIVGIWILILVFDVFDIMRKLKMDEREKIHEAIAERNALWGILIVLIIGIFYYLIASVLQQKTYVIPFIVGALIIAIIIKAVSNIYLDRKN